MKYTEFYFMIQTYGFFILIGIFVLVMLGLGVAYLIEIIKEKCKRSKRK